MNLYPTFVQKMLLFITLRRHFMIIIVLIALHRKGHIFCWIHPSIAFLSAEFA
jgi:hypothetical protein